jgi:hypothetical protein
MFLTVALLKTKTRLIPLTLYVHEFDADTLKTSYIKKSVIAKIDMNECQTDEASYHQSGKYGDTKYKISRIAHAKHEVFTETSLRFTYLPPNTHDDRILRVKAF